MKQKLLAFGLIFIMIFMLIPNTILAVAPTFSISISNSNPSIGDEVEVVIQANNVNDMYGFEINLSFEPDLWDTHTITFSSELIGFKQIVNPELLEQGHLRFVYANTGTAAGGNVTLGIAKFKAKQNGVNLITLDSIKMVYSNNHSETFNPGVTANVKIGSDSTPVPGSSTSAPTSTPTSTPIPTSFSQIGSVTVIASLDTNGKAVADVNTNVFNAAIREAKDFIVEISIQGTESAKEVIVNLTGDSIKTALDNKIKQINIKTGLAMISISTDLLKNNGVTSGNVQLSAAILDSSTMSDEVKAAVGSNPIYDFNLSVDGKKISQFGNNAVTVKLNYTLKLGEDPDQIIIYYINEDGKLEIVKNGKYDATTAQVVFSPVHFSMYAASYNGVSFNDLANVSWAKDSIEALAARNIVKGVGAGSFNPDNQLTRAELITMLMNAFDLIDSNAKSSLSDVKNNTWYYSAIASAQQIGIIKGKSDGSFGINEKISRQDIAVMIYNTGLVVKANMNGNGEIALFTDQSAIATYAVHAVTVIQQAGIINGVGNGTFAPRGEATRAQAAVIIWRMLSKVK